MSKELEIRHCRVLTALRASGGIAAAARDLGLAQSTVSETLLSLERVLGTPVIVRRPGREAALTPAAEALLPHAQALISASEMALEVFAAKSQGIIRLGAVESISSFLLPAPLQAFKLQWPRADVRITVGLCDDLGRRVRQFELDAALTIDRVAPPVQRPGSWQRELSQTQLRLVVSRENPLGNQVLEQSDFASRTLLLADPAGSFNALLEDWLSHSTATPKYESAGSIDGVKRAVQRSDAIGVLPAYAVAEELSSEALFEVKVGDPLPPIALQLTTLEPPIGMSPLHHLVELISEAFSAVH